MKKIGFLINPIAGMGGLVGLKGTNGRALESAIKLGAKPVAEVRAESALESLVKEKAKIKFYTCLGKMGSEALEKFNFIYECIYKPSEPTSALDTKKACREFLSENVDLILFCGGDGTARDIYEVVDRKLPLIGIPAGVKMHSAVFGINPQVTSEIVRDFLAEKLSLRDAEIMDTDEEKYRKNILATRLFGYALVPYQPLLVQTSKGVYLSESEDLAKEDIARYFLEGLEENALYILSAGTTTQKIAELLNLDKTLLGVDVLKDKKLLAKDVNEEKLLSLLEKHKKAFIVISPIGAQGFIFGRGNQQLSAKVIEKVGLENILVLATPYKLSQTKYLLVDTGNEELDRKLSGYRKIITGYHQLEMKRIGLPKEA